MYTSKKSHTENYSFMRKLYTDIKRMYKLKRRQKYEPGVWLANKLAKVKTSCGMKILGTRRSLLTRPVTRISYQKTIH